MTTIVAPSHPFLATGKTDVTLSPVISECTVAQAAETLRMSERRLNDLLDAGRIPFRWKNDERVIAWECVQDFERDRECKHATVDAIIRRDQEMGLYDD